MYGYVLCIDTYNYILRVNRHRFTLHYYNDGKIRSTSSATLFSILR